MHFCFCTRLNWGSTGVYLCSPPHLWYHLQTQTIEVRPRVSGLSAPCPSSSPGSFEGKAYVSASASCDSGRTADAPRRHLKSPRTDFKVSGHLSFLGTRGCSLEGGAEESPRPRHAETKESLKRRKRQLLIQPTPLRPEMIT